MLPVTLFFPIFFFCFLFFFFLLFFRRRRGVLRVPIKCRGLIGLYAALIISQSFFFVRSLDFESLSILYFTVVNSDLGLRRFGTEAAYLGFAKYDVGTNLFRLGSPHPKKNLQISEGPQKKIDHISKIKNRTK